MFKTSPVILDGSRFLKLDYEYEGNTYSNMLYDVTSSRNEIKYEEGCKECIIYKKLQDPEFCKTLKFVVDRVKTVFTIEGIEIPLFNSSKECLKDHLEECIKSFMEPLFDEREDYHEILMDLCSSISRKDLSFTLKNGERYKICLVKEEEKKDECDLKK